METFTHIIQQLMRQRTPADATLIQQTYDYAVAVILKNQEQKNQAEKNLDQALHKGLRMAKSIADLGLDVESIVACILFPVISLEQLQSKTTAQFPAPILKLLAGVHQMDSIAIFHDTTTAMLMQLGQLDKLRKMLLAMIEDIRVVLIKLVECLCLLRAANELSDAERKRIAEQARDIYAPLANRLGIGHLKWELEDLSLRYLSPEIYKKIARLLDERRVDREHYIQQVIKILSAELAQEGIDAEVTGRPKHIYSIWKKMQQKKLDYADLYDVRAVRILVHGDITTCYAALAVAHRLWTPITQEFDDYIAHPKPNGYRSLHTAVIGPADKALEIQIRTPEMHEGSEMGFAAHWRYKEGVEHDPGYEKKLACLRQLLDWSFASHNTDRSGDPADPHAAPTLTDPSLVDEAIYVLTPKGQVIDLQQGATPLDFAYHVHTSLGHRCRGAKVNGRIVPLTYRLKTGERVDILTHPDERPSRDWMNAELGYLKSSRGRAKVSVWFKRQNRDQDIIAGRALIARESTRLGVMHAVDTPDYVGLTERYHFKSTDDILAALGRGDIKLSQIFHTTQVPRKEMAFPAENISAKRISGGSDVEIDGMDNLLTVMARCCKPIPGDPIQGYITQGKGVSIHRQDCSNLLKMLNTHADRLLPIAWGRKTEKRYPVMVSVEALQKEQVLQEIMALLAKEGVALIALQMHADPILVTTKMLLTLGITDATHLQHIIDRLKAFPDVLRASREVK